MRAMSRRPALAVALALAVWPGARAAAQPTADDAAAEALFDEAVALRNAGDRAAACSKFRQSYQLSAARGTLLNIAECFEAESKLASAWAAYSTLADAAEAADDRERLAIARAKRAELEPRLARLTITVTAPPAGVVVHRDDSTIPLDVLGEPVPLDAGSHTITVSAPGHEPWRTTIEVVDGARPRVEVPALVPLPPRPVVDAPGDAPATTRRRHPRATAGLVALGAGAVGAAVGLGFGVAAWRAEADADPTCDAALVCDAYGYGRLQDAHAHADRADLFVGLGAALVVGGAVLYWTAPDGAEVTVRPVAGPDAVGVAIGGRL